MAGPIHVEEYGYLDPVAAFARVAAEPFALLFDSALQDPRHGRYARSGVARKTALRPCTSGGMQGKTRSAMRPLPKGLSFARNA